VSAKKRAPLFPHLLGYSLIAGNFASCFSLTWELLLEQWDNVAALILKPCLNKTFGAWQNTERRNQSQACCIWVARNCKDKRGRKEAVKANWRCFSCLVACCSK